MNPDNDRKYFKVKKATLLIAILVLAAGLFGWWIGRNKDAADNHTNNTGQSSGEIETNDTTGVKSLVRYTLPDGWKEASCTAAAGAVFITPSGATDLDCAANPSSVVKISVDPANNKDCNQLQNVQNVSKHICISEYINGRKSLKAETVYNEASSYKKDTAINAYYIDTGKGVVKLEYVHPTSDNGFLGGFEQLAKSVQVK